MVQSIPKNAIILIDGSAFLYRAYYALRPLHTADGTPVQATFGFCRSIKKIIDDFSPHYMVLVWDSPAKTFRSDIYEHYKATRQQAPSDLHVQKEQIKEFARLIDLYQLAKEGYEADDLLASFAEEHKDRYVAIVTPDKDLRQLISSKVVIFDPFKNEIIDQDRFVEKYEFVPSKLIFYHSLLGDVSDNIPGVRGIGDKTATDLVKQFDSLEDLYANLGSVKKERTRTLLTEQKENAFISYKLFTLRTYELSIPLKKIEFNKDSWWNAYDFFKKLEFKTFLKNAPSCFEQKELFEKNNDEAELKQVDWNCEIVTTPEQLKALVEKIKEKKFFAFDAETMGFAALQDGLVGLSIAYSDKTGYYIPVGHTGEGAEEQLDRELVIKMLKPIFEDPAITKTAHNAKFDDNVLWSAGIDVQGMEFDSLLAASLLRKEWQKIGLKYLSLHYLQEPMKAFKEVLGKRKTFDQVPIKEAALYAAHDALQTFKLHTVLVKELKNDEKLQQLFSSIELPFYHVLKSMERAGMALDVERLRVVGEEINSEIKSVEEKIQTVLDAQNWKGEINLNSPKQVEELLFDRLGLPSGRRSKEGRRSTDQWVLAQLSKQHPVPGLILRYRELFKLKSSYVEPLQELLNQKTGRIHTTFNQIDVATGRLSSSDPNLQNIPAAAGYGIKIRSAFTAGEGKRLLSADYSQIELRVLAHFSKDKNLVNAFKNNADIHTQTAAQIFGVNNLAEVTSEQRAVGKRINFSIIYGLTPYGLSQDLGIKLSDAKSYIEKYFEQYPGVAKWLEDVVEKAKKTGYVETWWGRRRYIPQLLESNHTLYEVGRRAAINMPIQGTSAEIVKKAMLELAEIFAKKKLKSKIVLQIHDEIIIELPLQEEEEVREIVKKTMENIVDWEVPFKVDLRLGKNWGEVTK